ncbi:hypothetical protein AWB69_00156 [Caballeronia udeis]|uniref:Uncharacterized protein n=1 Tax=Caballeronia udeis TaxID=1232866 RepID=A0A158EUG7_9BURK|nr:hypothetical protein AWB69_00156 [Caballeronia udeis]
MAKAWVAPGHCAAEASAGQTAGRSLGVVPNPYCKPQCDRPALVRAMPRRDNARAGQSPLPTLLPVFPDGSVT